MKARFSQLSVLFFVMSLFFVTTSQAQTPTEKVETEFKVSEKILKKYVGSYTFFNGMEAEITLKEGKLYGTQVGSGQDPMHLFALSKSKFKIKVMGAEIEFSENDNGEVTGVTFYQQGQEMIGTKD